MTAGRQPIYVGCGTGGIGLLYRDVVTGTPAPGGVAAPVEGTRFLAWHPSGRRLYSADGSGVTVLDRRPDDQLEVLDHAALDTGAPCHLSVDATGRYLLSADYAAGTVRVHEIRDDGTLGRHRHRQEHVGSGPDRQRQDRPHPHQVVTDPGGCHVLVTDLGSDAVYVYALDGTAGRLVEVSRTRLAPGTGPRHLAFASPTRLYVAGELDATVTAYDYSPGTGTLREVWRSASIVDPPAGTRTYPSAIVASADGRNIYVANRGADVLGTLALDGKGNLASVRDVPCRGRWPLDLARVDATLYVANHRSDSVCAFRIDAGTGRLAPLGEPVTIASPTCIAPAPCGRAGP